MNHPPPREARAVRAEPQTLERARLQPCHQSAGPKAPPLLPQAGGKPQAKRLNCLPPYRHRRRANRTCRSRSCLRLPRPDHRPGQSLARPAHPRSRPRHQGHPLLQQHEGDHQKRQSNGRRINQRAAAKPAAVIHPALNARRPRRTYAPYASSLSAKLWM